MFRPPRRVGPDSVRLAGPGALERRPLRLTAATFNCHESGPNEAFARVLEQMRVLAPAPRGPGAPTAEAPESPGSPDAPDVPDLRLAAICLQELDMPNALQSKGRLAENVVLWEGYLKRELRARYGLRHAVTSFLTGVALYVFASEDALRALHHIESFRYPLGYGRISQNKVGVAVSLCLWETSLVFLGCHLCHGQGNLEPRVEQVKTFMGAVSRDLGLREDRSQRWNYQHFLASHGMGALRWVYGLERGGGGVAGEARAPQPAPPPSSSVSSALSPPSPPSPPPPPLFEDKPITHIYNGLFLCYDYVVFLGDTNFRCDTERAVTSEEVALYLQDDQLRAQMAAKHSPLRRFQEAPIRFLPTYKLAGPDEYVPKRVPSYCDRVLYYANPKVHGNPAMDVSAFGVGDGAGVGEGAERGAAAPVGAGRDPGVFSPLQLLDQGKVVSSPSGTSSQAPPGASPAGAPGDAPAGAPGGAPTSPPAAPAIACLSYSSVRGVDFSDHMPVLSETVLSAKRLSRAVLVPAVAGILRAEEAAIAEALRVSPAPGRAPVEIRQVRAVDVRESDGVPARAGEGGAEILLSGLDRGKAYDVYAGACLRFPVSAQFSRAEAERALRDVQAVAALASPSSFVSGSAAVRVVAEKAVLLCTEGGAGEPPAGQPGASARASAPSAPSALAGFAEVPVRVTLRLRLARPSAAEARPPADLFRQRTAYLSLSLFEAEDVARSTGIRKEYQGLLLDALVPVRLALRPSVLGLPLRVLARVPAEAVDGRLGAPLDVLRAALEAEGDGPAAPAVPPVLQRIFDGISAGEAAGAEREATGAEGAVKGAADAADAAEPAQAVEAAEAAKPAKAAETPKAIPAPSPSSSAIDSLVRLFSALPEAQRPLRRAELRGAGCAAYIRADPVREALFAALGAGYRRLPAEAWQRLGMALVWDGEGPGEDEAETSGDVLLRALFAYRHGGA